MGKEGPYTEHKIYDEKQTRKNAKKNHSTFDLAQNKFIIFFIGKREPTWLWIRCSGGGLVAS